MGTELCCGMRLSSAGSKDMHERDYRGACLTGRGIIRVLVVSLAVCPLAWLWGTSAWSQAHWWVDNRPLAEESVATGLPPAAVPQTIFAQTIQNPLDVPPALHFCLRTGRCGPRSLPLTLLML